MEVSKKAIFYMPEIDNLASIIKLSTKSYIEQNLVFFLQGQSGLWKKKNYSELWLEPADQQGFNDQAKKSF